MTKGKCPPPIKDPDRTDFKIGNMVLIRNHTPKDDFDSKYKSVLELARKFQTRHLMYKTVLERSGKCQ